MLSSFTVENYRAFSRPQNIELRPLTLVFGWNSGGKSALVRFLPLIAESLRAPNGPPIVLSGVVGRKTTWPELVCKATERGVIKFGFHWNDSPQITAEWEINGDLEGRWQETKSLFIRRDKNFFRTFDPLTDPAQQWDGLLPRIQTKAHLNELQPDLATDSLEKIRMNLSSLAHEVQWLSGVRTQPERLITYGGAAPATLNPNGEGAIEHLISAQLETTSETSNPTLEYTRSFFRSLGEQLTLDNPLVGTWRALLSPINSSRVSVNLCDTGEGYAQVLPVLVALARARTDGPRMLCLEQPELHLHTRAQAELATCFVDTVKDARAPHLLVETHSEVLLTSIQLAIANGELKPEMVRVYWVEARGDGTSDAVSIDFDEAGRPSNSALTVAFNEAIELGQALMTKQLAKKK